MKNLNIPVGVSDFAEIRKNDYYYVDKTGLITEFLKTPATKVTLITRPRRFGKTLGMSMLENFFDIRKDSQELFAGLHISKCAEVCQEWMTGARARLPARRPGCSGPRRCSGSDWNLT